VEERIQSEATSAKPPKRDTASFIVDLFRRRPELGSLLFGVVGVLLIPRLLAGGEYYFWPSWSVEVGYFIMFANCFLRRAEDQRFCFGASALAAGVTVFFYARAYSHWNSLGLILDYEMPPAVLAIVIPAFIILVGRRIQSRAPRSKV